MSIYDLQKKLGKLLLPPNNYGVKTKVKKKYYYVEFENGKRRRFESNIDRYDFISSFLSLNPEYSVWKLSNVKIDVLCLHKQIIARKEDFINEDFTDEDCEDLFF